MAEVNGVDYNVKVVEFRQEQGDFNYGSCLWARFYFDLDNYCLMINSDCGNWMYKWFVTPSEPFMELMKRCEGGYLLDKMAVRDTWDDDKIKQNINEYINSNELRYDIESWEYDKDLNFMEEVDSELYDSDKVTEVIDNLMWLFDSTQVLCLDYNEICNLVELDFPNNAKFIS